MQKTCCILMAGGKLQSPRKNLSLQMQKTCCILMAGGKLQSPRKNLSLQMQKTCCILMAGGKLQSPRKNLSSQISRKSGPAKTKKYHDADAEADSPLQVAVPPPPQRVPLPAVAEKREADFRRRTRLALARFAWLKQRKELRFLLSCTLWRWSLTSSRRRCLGARSYLRNRYQQVADWHNLLAAFHRWRSRGKSKRYLVAVDLSDDSRLRYHRPATFASPSAATPDTSDPSPWLSLLRRVAFHGWGELCCGVRGRRKLSAGAVLKERLELGCIDWVSRKALSDHRLAQNLLSELRDETAVLHRAIDDLDLKVRTSQGHQLLRHVWRLWRHGRPWCDTALMPLAMRHWLSLALVRWAILARKRQLPRWICGRRLMLQEALSCRMVWSCFAAWHLACSELSASNVQAQLLRCVKALGAFDLQLLQLCPEITSDGLCAMQVKCVDLSQLLQEHFSNNKLDIARPCVGFPCQRFRYFQLLRRVAFQSWRKKAAQIPKDRGPWCSLRPLLRLSFHAWRFRSAAQRVATALPRRLRARRQMLRDWRLLRKNGAPKMLEYRAVSLLHVT
ncbi:unnamed protein product [Cladocopium goreaui]|uniref:Uncharacterized protein n=1 Tax=Cladocopium goreaui TaxID=2562237 RepID=A0A9P1BZA7_9DINO|nr:unnamed protein product [Cladocopium goreaui]